MAGFSKLFSTMWGGSLYGRFEASAVFMVVLSLCDQNGDLDMTPEAIAGTTGWPADFIRKGLAELIAPDPRSRTPDHDGRRLLPLDEHRDWGWTITNYAKYREQMRSLERREYLREAKRREREVIKSTRVNTSTSVNRVQPIAEAEAEAEAEASPLLPTGKRRVRKAPATAASATAPTWEAYQSAYRQRYGVPPIRNRTVNGQLANLVARLGQDEAPSVARYYVQSNAAYYVRNGHSIGGLLHDAEKLRTEWATGRQMTETRARQVDKTQAIGSVFLELMEENRNG